MKLLTNWSEWFDKGRQEYKFHCDLLLGPGEKITIETSDGHKQVIASSGGFTKVHLAASWEHRPTEFVGKEP